MYQAVYPWLARNQFSLYVPRTANNSNWNESTQTMVNKIRAERPDYVTFGDRGFHCFIMTNYEADEMAPSGANLYSASMKLMSFVSKRDAHVVFHGPDTCNDKKPWSRYEHFHLTFLSKCRPGVDTMWSNVVAQHKAVTSGCQIPFTQTTKFPGSWANYLTQEPRITWRVPICQLMDGFSSWVFEKHVEKDPPAVINDGAVAGPSNAADNEHDFKMPSGKSMNLYKYVKWLITTFGHATRESLIEGALAAADTSTFERALTHPMFDSICYKAFAVDKSLEVMQGFKTRYGNIGWEKFESDDGYLDVDVSMRLIRHLLSFHGNSL